MEEWRVFGEEVLPEIAKRRERGGQRELTGNFLSGFFVHYQVRVN